MCDIFKTRNLNHNLRSKTDFMRERVSNFSFKLSSLKYLATKRWDIAPCDIRSIEKLNFFKKKKKKRNWEPKECHCTLCKQYVFQ